MPSKSKQQQKFMGMAHALKKGEMKPSDASPELKKVAKSMSDKDVKDFASTSHKGLPKKVKQEIARKLREYANKMGTNTMGGDSIPSAKKGGLRDFDGYDNVDYNKDMPMDEVSSSDAYKISRMLGTGQQSTQDFIEDNKIDVKKLESYIKKLSPSKKIIIKDIINGSTDKRLSTIKKGLVKQVKESLDEAVDKSDLKNAKNRLKDPHTIEDIEYSKTRSGDKFVKIIYKKKYVTGKMMDTGPHFVSVFYNDEKDLQNIGKALKLKLKESLDESMMSTLDQMKKDSKNIRDFIKKVLSDKDFRDMKGDKDFIKYLGSMYEGVTEGGIPQNWMQGRTSDYHTKLRGKKRKYDDSNFDKENSGQPDLEESPNKVDFNSKGYKEATKLVSKLRSSIFKKLNDDELEQFRMVIAKSFDLKEYASKQDLSYILDKDSKLDGTPPSKDAIDSDLEEEYKRDYKAEYKKFQSSTKAKKYRAELNKYNRQKGTYGNGDGKDASHKGGKIVGFESESKNRGRREKSRLKKK